MIEDGGVSLVNPEDDEPDLEFDSKPEADQLTAEELRQMAPDLGDDPERETKILTGLNDLAHRNNESAKELLGGFLQRINGEKISPEDASPRLLELIDEMVRETIKWQLENEG